MRRMFVAILACLLTTQGWAEAPSKLVTLDTLDESRRWQGVGRINIGRGGFCTGTLIASDLVLTAAHCFFDKDTGARADDASIEFLAGWREDRAVASRGASRTVLHPDYIYESNDNIERVSADLALVVLDQPIRTGAIRPFTTNTAGADNVGQEVRVVSYAKGREDRPSLQRTCHVLASNPGVYVTSCDVDFGASGSPVFVLTNGRPQIMSVVSAKAEWNTQKVSLAAGLKLGLDPLMAKYRSRKGGHRIQSPGARRVTLGSDSAISGARFIKP